LPSERKIKQIVNQVLREHLAGYGFQSAEISFVRDADGDPVLFVDASYRYSDDPVNADAVLRAIINLRVALLRAGETRFPHIRHHFDEKQKVQGFA
jgi:hypothetical protein